MKIETLVFKKTTNLQAKKSKYKTIKNNCYNKTNFNTQNHIFPSQNNNFSFLGTSEVSILEACETINNDTPLSNAGFKGIVYKLDKKNKSYVIKVARTPEYKFDNEANILKKVPTDINCQKFITYFQHPTTNCDVLVSTFIEGTKGNLKSLNDFNKFFTLLFKLDKANILHGDLNMQNCLFGPNGIGLIDFGEGESYKTGDNYDDFIYPNFVLKSNIINLEHNGIPDCIQTWVENKEDSKQCFKNYLIAKSNYYKNHAEYLKLQNKPPYDAIDYEENYSKILKNPSDLIIENEIRRIDCLYTFEHADTAVNYKNIPNSAIRNWNLTVEKAKKQLEFINKTLENQFLTADEKKYFEYQKEIISLFYKQFNSWSSSTTEWLNELQYRNDLSDFERKFITNKNESMDLPPDLTKLILD